MASSGTVIVIIFIIFIIVDLILGTFIIIENKKYRACVNNESPFCLDFSCPYPFDESYKSFTNPSLQVPGVPVNFDTGAQEFPDSSIAAVKCSGFPYRLIDPKGGTGDDNIECRFQNYAGMQTEKATTTKT